MTRCLAAATGRRSRGSAPVLTVRPADIPVASVTPRAPRRHSSDDIALFGFLGLVVFGILFVLVLGMTGHLM